MERGAALTSGIIIFLLVIYSCHSTIQSHSSTAFPKIFVLLKANQLPTKDILTSPIYGISVRVHWKILQPAPKSFNWQYLDEIFHLANKYHIKK